MKTTEIVPNFAKGGGGGGTPPLVKTKLFPFFSREGFPKKVEASGQEGTDLVENGLESDNIIKEKVQVEDEVTTEENLNLSQVEKSPANLHDNLKEKRKHYKRNKTKSVKKKERLLKFQQKLVESNGDANSKLELS